MELGAGTCWLLHFLNRYGCPTIDVESLESCALACGFSKMTVVPIGLPLSVEVPVGNLRDFLLGRELVHYWGLWTEAIRTTTYIVLYKGEYHPTTRNPDNLQARIEPAVDRERVTAGAPMQTRTPVSTRSGREPCCRAMSRPAIT